MELIHTDSRFIEIAEVLLGGITNPNTRRAYEMSLRDFMEWWQEAGSPRLSKALINTYKKQLFDEGMGPSSINRRLSAIKKMVTEARDNQMIDPVVAQGILNVEGIPLRGKSTANWLTKDEAQALLNVPDVETIKGVRDRAMLAVLLGCGLRRDELVSLKWEDIQQRDGRWVVVVRRGKRNKSRVVPMAPWTKVALDKWKEVIPPIGLDLGSELVEVLRPGGMYIFLPLDKSGNVTNISISVDTVYQVVKGSCAELELDNISPHDLRRTFAKLARKGGAHLEQIQYSLGHDAISTTMKYIGEEVDFYNAPCDVLGLGI